MNEIKMDLFPEKLRGSKKRDKKDIAKNVVIPTEPLPESSRPRKDGPGGEYKNKRGQGICKKGTYAFAKSVRPLFKIALRAHINDVFCRNHLIYGIDHLCDRFRIELRRIHDFLCHRSAYFQLKLKTC